MFLRWGGASFLSEGTSWGVIGFGGSEGGGVEKHCKIEGGGWGVPPPTRGWGVGGAPTHYGKHGQE